MPTRGTAYVRGLVLLLAAAVSSTYAAADRVMLHGHVPSAVAGLVPQGRLPATNHLALSIGLPLRNEAALDDLLQRLYDPQSSDFHKFLTPQEFTVRFGPTEEDYQAVISFAEANGLIATAKHPNRVVLDVRGAVSNVERAFNLTLRTYKHPTEAREFFAPDIEPSVPTNLPVTDMWGLSDYGRPRPLSHKVDPARMTPLNYNGSGPGGAYQGRDFRNAYVPGPSPTGNGQVAAVAEFDGYSANDITNYENQCGYAYVPLQNVLLDNVSGKPGYSGVVNAVVEVSLDIEMLIDMAPGLSKLIVYEGSSPYDVFNRIVTDNSAKQVSCSWVFGYGPSHTWVRHSSTSTLDSQLKQMAAQGQSFFQACGDSDAYTGSQALSTSSGPEPVDSIYVTSVGGTSLNMNGTGSSWYSESVWNWGGNTGTGGGISPNYTIPSWQTNVNMTANSGSTSYRNIPDVALTADAVYVLYSNGLSIVVGGTSCAAPLWAGYCALINQQSVAASGTTMGLLNPALYAIGAGPNYANCFHDITIGNNIGSHTPGLFIAVTNYDLCTGLGTPNGTNLINVLAPPALPYIISPPPSQTVTSGSRLMFSASGVGQSPLKYQWLFNGTNLPSGGNLSGTTSNVLSIAAATTNNAGNYQLVVTNNSGSATSSVATLTVVFPPAITGSLTNQTLECGGNITYAVTASGTPPLSFQWRLDGSPIAGATTTSLSLANVHLPSHTVTLVVTSPYASLTSNAVLTVQDTLPPVVTLNGANPLYLELGSAFSDPGARATDVCAGTLPVSTSGAVNVNVVGTNLLTYTANDGSGNTNTATRVVIVRDTTPPTILSSFATLVLPSDTNCVARMPEVTGTNFILASDLSGTLTISQSPTNSAVLPLGTNIVVIRVADASGNAAYSTNTIVVQEQMPPRILSDPQSQTNLAGATVSFSAGATACTPLTLQWLFNYAPLVAQTNDTLTLSNITSAAAGGYSLVATASGGSATSAVATLTVTLLPSAVALDSLLNPSGYKDPLTITATVTPATATGSVRFLTNGTAFDLQMLVAGQATSTNVPLLPRGTNFIVAVYSGDASELPSTNSLAQIVTNHPPAAAPAFYSRAAGHTLNIAVADLATNWTDVDGATVSLAGFSVSTNGITLADNAGTLVYSNYDTVADQFTCTLSDGFGGTNVQTVSIAIVPPLSSTPDITVVVGNPDGSFTLSLTGAPGDTYVLEATTSMSSPGNWQPVATNTLDASGIWQFTDGQATNFAQRFYRVKLVQ